MAHDLPADHASADAGMVMLATLQVGDEFTFYPRRGRFKVTGRTPVHDRTIYVGIDAEGKSVTPQPTVALAGWSVWLLSKEG